MKSLRNSIIGKIITLFFMIFVFLLVPIVVQSLTSFRQEVLYRETIDNIIHANQLSLDVSEKIEPLVWNIVAGKENFEDSGIMPLIFDIRLRMTVIMNNTESVTNRGLMEIALRALSILEDYLIMLRIQIEERYPVAENERLLEEIRGCIDGVNDLLLEFTSMQVEEASYINQAMARQSNRNRILNFSLSFIVIVIGIFAFWYIHRSLMNPINKLLQMSNRISKGDFSYRSSLSASREFNDLAVSMNAMAEQIELLLAKGIEEQKQLQVMEYRVLQAQISPHFLYNTLDAIIWAAETKRIPEVVTLVTSLSAFFRISLSHGIDFIPVSDEIEHVRNYLIIQQIRYNDVLTYEINADEEVMQKKIPKLILQPLVENSLYHGIKNTRDRGKIVVTVKEAGGLVQFSVMDTGIGMKPEMLDKLKKDINNGTGEKGFGLFNVNKRLKLCYDLPGGIEIESEYKKGTKVSFTLEI